MTIWVAHKMNDVAVYIDPTDKQLEAGLADGWRFLEYKEKQPHVWRRAVREIWEGDPPLLIAAWRPGNGNGA